MKAPKNEKELAKAIDSLVTSYMRVVRENAAEAVIRGISPSRMNTKKAKARRRNERRPAKETGAQRSAAEIVEVSESLHEFIRKHPGQTMLQIAEAMDTTTDALRHPMRRLKDSNRVRSLGKRAQTCYFPAVEKGSRTGR